jgi:hypothetical protein
MHTHQMRERRNVLGSRELRNRNLGADSRQQHRKDAVRRRIAAARRKKNDTQQNRLCHAAEND